MRIDLTEKKYGDLLVLKKADALQNRYYTWLCRCSCGNEIIVNTKNLTDHRTTHCGCKSEVLRNRHLAIYDRTGDVYGALTVVRYYGKGKNGEFLWECLCKCGKTVRVPATKLKSYLVKDCGCGLGLEILKYKDIHGMRKGKLTALYPTDRRGGKGSVYWICRCECGNETEMTESDFIFGTSISCGCVRKQRWEEFSPNESLTFVDGTCVEVLDKRKNRSDNTSGFRGVTVEINRYRVTIGLKGKQYSLGRYSSFDEAVRVRLRVEEYLHNGFVDSWNEWNKKAADEKWAVANPFFFDVEKDGRSFNVSDPIFGIRKFSY